MAAVGILVIALSKAWCTAETRRAWWQVVESLLRRLVDIVVGMPVLLLASSRRCRLFLYTHTSHRLRQASDVRCTVSITAGRLLPLEVPLFLTLGAGAVAWFRGTILALRRVWDLLVLVVPWLSLLPSSSRSLLWLPVWLLTCLLLMVAPALIHDGFD